MIIVGAGQSDRLTWCARPFLDIKDGATVGPSTQAATRPAGRAAPEHAGTSVIRTAKASMATPTARPKEIVLIGPSLSGTKAAKTANMIAPLQPRLERRL